MPKVVVTTLRDVRVPTALGTDPVTPPRDQLGIDTILVRVRLLARVALGDAFPHLAPRRLVASADGEGERLGTLIGPAPRGYPPEPVLLFLTAHVSPDLVALDRVASL